MSLLQIRRLEGPGEILLYFSGMSPEVHPPGVGNHPDIFTCILNRPVESTDTFPLCVKVNIYNERGILISQRELSVTRDKITASDITSQADCFRFRLGNLFLLSGGSIYVHVCIENTGDNISFRAGFTDNYHETIKQVYIVSERKFKQVYWSGNEQISSFSAIPVAPRENEIGSIYANEDAFLHIKAAGLYNETVNVIIRANGLEVRRARIPLYHNRKSVVVNMRELIARYCRLKKITDIPSVTTLSVEAIVTYEYMTYDKTVTLQGNTAKLQLVNKDTASPQRRSHTGSVYFNVNTGDTEEVEPMRYRNFLLGYMCHIEGVGKLANRYDNSKNDNPRFTVYPFHTYEIMLSDLVKCGLITENEAAYMTTENHNMRDLKDRERLEEEFNKNTVEIASGTKLIDRFLDSGSYSYNGSRLTLANSAAIRKLLAQVRSKDEVFTDINRMYVCRDSWQIKSRKNGVLTRIHTRPHDLRYDRNKECPFGEFFLNFIESGSHYAAVSRYYNNKLIHVYNENRMTGTPESPNNEQRDGIAIHTGGARYSTGCLTFNFGNGGDEPIFNGLIYNNLNFLYIDKRNAKKIENDTRVYNGTRVKVYDTGNDSTITLNRGDSFDFGRYYDLVEPNNDLNVNSIQ